MHKRFGFTLIELLIVVAIIAILAAIAVPNFLEAQTRAKVSRARADLRSTATALEAYAVDHNAYPPMSDVTPISSWSTWQDIGSGGDDHSRIPSYLTTPVAYITSLTFDPFIPLSTLTGADYIIQIGKRYAYFNYKQFMDTPPVSASLQSRANDAGAWLMYSYGPDKDPFNNQGAVYVNYDSTNGTITPGNIFRTQRTSDKYERFI